MKTKNPFHYDAEGMAQDFKRLANERQAEFEAQEVEEHEPGVKVAEE